MNVPVRAALAGVLRSARADLNARFAEMKRRKPDLDAAAFSVILRTMVDPLAEAVAAMSPDRVPATVFAAYDSALIIAAERLAGPGGRYPVISDAWQSLLPAIVPLVAQAPGRVIGAVTNALCQLAGTPEIRASDWTARLLAIAPELTSVDVLLRAGQVAAWRCGLAHYREGALAAADALPPAIGLRLLEAPADADWAEVRARLAKERWWNPAQDLPPEPLRVTRTAGTFRGFGGLFAEPPVVASLDSQILVRSGDGFWLLKADAFGATFHRAEASEFNAAGRDPSLRITQTSVMQNGHAKDLPELGKVTSAAATGDTIAVTGTLTHRITLLALS